MTLAKTYQQYKEEKQAEFNALPIFFAFSNEQLYEEMKKHGLRKTDTDKLLRVGDTGGFFLKKDAPQIHEWLNRRDELEDLMKDPEFAESAFYYEMGNHEYHINLQADWDVCGCFGNCEYEYGKSYRDYLKEEGYGEPVVEAFAAAKQRFLADANTNGWY